MRRVGNFTLFFGAEDAFSNRYACRFSYHDVDFVSVEQFTMRGENLLGKALMKVREMLSS